jgi:hypothetical protein
MNETEQMPETRSPMPRIVGVASLSCLVSLILFYWAVRGAVSEIGVWWEEWLVYATVPVLLTFLILYRSCWHPEITGAARTCYLFLLSCLIFAGDIVAVGAMLGLAVFFIGMMAFGFNAFEGGNH